MGGQPDYGLEIIHEPIDAAKIDIVFAQGLTDDRKGAWKKDNVLWPEKLLPNEILHARIIVIGYSAIGDDTMHDVDLEMIKGHASQISSNPRLRARRVKRYLLSLSRQALGAYSVPIYGLSGRDQSDISIIAKRIQGLLLLGTPLQAPHSSSYLKTLERVRQVAEKVSPQSSSDLKNASNGLEDLASLFIVRLRRRAAEGNKIQVQLFYEAQDTSGTIAVPLESVKIDGYEDPIKIEVAHTDMSKYKSKNEKGYQAIVAAIKKIVQPQSTTSDSQHLEQLR